MLSQLSMIVSTKDVPACRAAIVQLLGFMKVERDYIDRATEIFDDVYRLYSGLYPGYRHCDTPYHDFQHVLDVTLASLRLCDAAILAGEQISAHGAFLACIAALFHDTGYIPTLDDQVETGAVYTPTHVSRSIIFAQKYMAEKNYSGDDIQRVSQMILLTDLAVEIKYVLFIDRENEILAKIVAAGDLLGQMADRIYLEKLPYLYLEFRAANITAYTSEEDLMLKTCGFFKVMDNRFKNDLDNVADCLYLHFNQRYGINVDLYKVGMQHNLEYLSYIMTEHPGRHRDFLKRDGIIKKL